MAIVPNRKSETDLVSCCALAIMHAVYSSVTSETRSGAGRDLPRAASPKGRCCESPRFVRACKANSAINT